jgi:hypothetical protein
MVAVETVAALRVQIDSCSGYQAAEELAQKPHIETARSGLGKLGSVYEVGAPARIDRCFRKGVVHGYHGVSEAGNVAELTDDLRKGSSQDDADILDEMVRIDLDISLPSNRKRETTVKSKGMKHMIEERQTEIQVDRLPVRKIKLKVDLSFFRVSFDDNRTYLHLSASLKRSIRLLIRLKFSL